MKKTEKQDMITMNGTGQTESGLGVSANRKIRDSVFSSLFEDKKYLLQLYRTLRPEDAGATEDSLTDVTIENVLTDKIYNDLGFIANGRLLILVESQSTFTLNILIRIFLYLAQSYHEYFERTGQNLYTQKKVTMPEPELYVIYTGEREKKPDEISLSRDFFDGKKTAVDIKVKVIYESGTHDIIDQYIVFCKVYDGQRKIYGTTFKAIEETIRICKNRNVLKEYLESREMEVVSIMRSLYNQEDIMRSYIKNERREATENATRQTTIDNARRMLRLGKITVEDLPDCFPDMKEADIHELESEFAQLA